MNSRNILKKRISGITFLCIGVALALVSLLTKTWYQEATQTKLKFSKVYKWESLDEECRILKNQTIECKSLNGELIADSEFRIQCYSGPFFPAFGLKRVRYGLSFRFQSECRKIRTRITLNTDTFHAV